MKKSSLSIIVATMIGAFLMLRPACAGTVTWQELTPSYGGNPSSAITVSSGSGTDLLTFDYGGGGSPSYNINYGGGATFRYQVIWSPSYPSEPAPSVAVLTFDQYGANQSTISAGCAPGGSGSGTITAVSSVIGPVTATAVLTPPNTSTSSSNGSRTLSYVGSAKYQVPMTKSGSVWVGNFSTSAYGALYGSGSFTNGGGGGEGYAQVKLVLTSAGAVTWQEVAPTNVVQGAGPGSGASLTDTYGSGTDTLFCGYGYSNGGDSYYGAVSNATFNYVVTYVGTGAPANASITFDRYGANYISGGGGSGTPSIVSGTINATASSSAAIPSATISLTLSPSNPTVNGSNGSTTLTSAGTYTTSSSPFAWNGSAYVANIAVPCTTTVNGSAHVVNGSGGSGGSSSFKQVFKSLTVN